MKEVLVTDTLFVSQGQEQQLLDAGFAVARLPKPDATEEELIAAVAGKAGYILGGTERVTRTVIDAADELKAIVFTGTDYKSFIPGWQRATEKGIAIANVPDGHTHAVAEWAFAAALAMNRGFFELARNGTEQFRTTPGIEGQQVGIVGLGRIGCCIAELVKPDRPAALRYYSAHRHPDQEPALGLTYAELPDMLEQSDVVFLGVSYDGNKGFFGAAQLERMKPGSLLVSFMQPGVIDEDALFDTLRLEKIRAISDYPMGARFDAFPLSRWYSFAASNAFNSEQGIAHTSNEATQSMIALLTTGNDKYLVNPTYSESVQS
jgi:phosphogluconate 2-dehydrogenase